MIGAKPEHAKVIEIYLAAIGWLTQDQALLAIALFDWGGLCFDRYRLVKTQTDRTAIRDLKLVKELGSMQRRIAVA